MSEIIFEFPEVPQFNFLIDLQGESLYQKWLSLGLGEGTHADFLNWLKVKGDAGVTPVIGENGNWFIAGIDSGLPSRGIEGPKGNDAMLPEGIVIDPNYNHVSVEEKVLLADIPNKQNATDNTLNTTDKTVAGAINEVRGLALEIPIGLVFATKTALDLWLLTPANKASLKNAQNLYIIDVNVPDYWWDFSAQIYHELEAKTVLSGYLTAVQIAEMYPNETPQSIGNLINSATEKTDLVDADKIPVSDSADGGKLKWWSFASMKAKLLNYFAGKFVAQNGGVIYHTTPWTTAGTVSTNGTMITGTGTAFTSLMSAVGGGYAKIVINGEERRITAFTNSTSLTVNESFSQNYINASYSIISPNIIGRADGFWSFLSNGGLNVQFLNSNPVSNNWSCVYANFGYERLAMSANYRQAWSNSNDSGWNATKDTGLRKNAPGILEIFDGVTNGAYRDIALRYIYMPVGTAVGDAVNDIRFYNNNGVITYQKCTVASATKGGGTWVTTFTSE